MIVFPDKTTKVPLGNEREALRETGQFWTPEWVALAMAAFVLKNDPKDVLDPAVGGGALLSAVARLSEDEALRLKGIDIDPEMLILSQESIPTKCLSLLREDFVTSPSTQVDSIIANPPYIRHHRVSKEVKKQWKAIVERIFDGESIDGRAGLHIYFLIKCLDMLTPGGRLAFLVPADTCEGVFAEKLWSWISANFRIHAVATFQTEVTPFPGIDTNALVLFIEKATPTPYLAWGRCNSRDNNLLQWVKKDFPSLDNSSLFSTQRGLKEAISTGFSRDIQDPSTNRFTLADFVNVMRGIASGQNEFFFLTSAHLKVLGEECTPYFVRAVGRTRDVPSPILTQETLNILEKKGRPTFLLSIPSIEKEKLPQTLYNYILEGERQGLDKKALLSTRNPWYKMEVRIPPDFLFAYLGRRDNRFIRNEAGVLPLSGFLCIYPLSPEQAYQDRLWRMLNDPELLKGLRLVGKSYGAGAIKVEPRALSRLPVPDSLLKKYDILPPGIESSEL